MKLFSIAVVSFVVALSSVTAYQAKPASPAPENVFFSTLNECRDAYIKGTAAAFVPAEKNIRKNRPGNAKSSTAALCADIRGLSDENNAGRSWVVLAVGTPIVYSDTGFPRVDARNGKAIGDSANLPPRP